ncbi:MAG: hypothetical protein R3B37_16855 [Nitrospira sp.]|nr:hypothetical protein [Nitrospira sp.]
MRQIMRLASVFIAFSLVLATQSIAATGPEPGIAKGNHQELAMYYADQAQDFKAKARFWDNTAESYEHHPELYKSSDIAVRLPETIGRWPMRPRHWRVNT